MIWITWALMLIAHGAAARWAEIARSYAKSAYAKSAFCADVLLVAIALITVSELQNLGFLDTLRIGVFFAAFGACGRQLMSSVMRRAA
jgi:hypothetical protein